MPCRVTRGLFLARGVRLGVTLVMRTSALVRGLFLIDLGPLGEGAVRLLLVRPLTLTETYNPEEADPVPAGAVRLILPSGMRRLRVLGDSLDTFECTLSVMLADLRGDFLLGVVVLADTLVAVLAATVTVALAVDLAAILGDTLAVVMAVDLAAVLGDTLAVVMAIDFGETLAVVLADSLLAMLAATVTVALADFLGVVLATTFFASPSLASVACSLSWDAAALELARRRRTTRSLASSLPAVESFAKDSL